MKSWIRLVFVSLFALAVVGCNGLGATTNPPGDDDDDNGTELQVSAVASVTSGIVPLEVEFTGLAVGGVEPYTYGWDFGDGATEQTPQAYHVFETAGNFVTTFTVSDAAGGFSSSTISLVIGSDDIPVAMAESDVTSGIAPLEVNFLSTVVGGDAPVAIEWSFGDGSTSTDANPTYTFDFAGNYVVRFLARDADGDEADATIPIVVGTDSKPVAAVGADPTSGPAPLDVDFTANAAGGNPALTYAWDFGDGNTSTMENPTHTYAADGTYTATLTVTDADGDAASSSASIVVQTEANDDPDLRLIQFDYALAGLADNYEPNDTDLTAYYLGSFGATYTVPDGYIDPYDALFHIAVANVGPAIATGFNVDHYRDPLTAPVAGDFGDDFDSVLSIGENGVKDVYFTWENAPPGSYASYAQVDSDNFVAEYDETNNVTSSLAVDVIADEDWYYVFQTSGFGITLTLDNLPGDYDLALYDENGALVDFSINANTDPESIDVLAPMTGDYFIRVYGFDGASSTGQPYNLTVVVE